MWGPGRPCPSCSWPLSSCCPCCLTPRALSLASAVWEEETGPGPHPLCPAPPSCLLGWDHCPPGPQGPASPTFSFYLRFLHSTAQPSPPDAGWAALCWALGQCWGADLGLLLADRGWTPIVRTETSSGGLLCPAPQGPGPAPDSPHQLHLPLGLLPALPRQSWVLSSDAS